MLRIPVTVGLVVDSPGPEDADPVFREFFFDRLIVPELRGGRPIWCIGRAVEDLAPALSSETPAAGELAVPSPRPRPKYLSLPGEKPVLGLDHVASRRSAYLVEGPFDWLAAV